MCSVTWKRLGCVSEARWWWAWISCFSILDLDWSPCFFPWAEIEESSYLLGHVTLHKLCTLVILNYQNRLWLQIKQIEGDASLKSFSLLCLNGDHSSSSENTQTLKDGLAPWICEESALGWQPKWAHPHHHHQHHLISGLIFTTPPSLPQLGCIEWLCCSVAWPLLLGGAVEGGGR